MTLLVREGLEPRQTLGQRLLLRVYSDRIKSYYMQNVSIKLELDFDEVRIKHVVPNSHKLRYCPAVYHNLG